MVIHELARLHVKHTAAHNIAGQQVRRELQPAEVARNTLGKCLADKRLAHTGDVFQQDVFACQKRDHALAHHVRLAQHHVAHVLFQAADQSMQLRKRRVFLTRTGHRMLLSTRAVIGSIGSGRT